MSIKIKNRDPKSTDFAKNDIIINIKEGTLFYKSNKGVHKLSSESENSTSSSYAVSSSYAASSSYAVSASYAISSSVEITQEITSSYAETASYADNLTSTVSYSEIQDVSATDRILGRDSAGAGNIEEITPANLRTMINVADGATANAGDATLAGSQTFSGQKSFSTSLTASIISASSFISAAHFSGDGSGLSNLPSTTHDGNFGTTPITASNFTASNAINSTVEAASGSFKYIR